MQRVAIEVYGEQLVANELDLTAARGESMLGIWPAVADQMENIEREQFASDGARGPHGPWPPLSNEWMWTKFQAGQSLEIMRATEMLMDSLVGPGEGSIRWYTDDTLEFGSTLDQFAIHQDPPADASYPTRYPIDFTESDILAFAETMTQWVLGTVNRAGQRVDPATRRFAKGGSTLR